MKKILALTICVIMAVAMFTGCLFQKNAETVLTVGDAKMSEDEFGFYLYTAKMQYLESNQMSSADDAAIKDFLGAKNGDKTNLDIIREDAEDKAFDVLVQYNKALEKGLGMTEADEKEFNEQLELIYTQNGGKETIKQQLDEMGVTVAGFEEFNKRYMVIEKLYNSLVEGGELEVSDEEISKYVGDNYIAKDYIKAQHILFSTVDNETQAPLAEEEIAAKKKLAEDTLKKIKAGGDFAVLMNELSEDPGLQSAPTGYIFTKGEMVAPFEEAAYALSDNGVSGIVETDYGYHIIKRIPLNMETIDEQEKANIVGELQAEKSEKLTAEWKKEAKLEKKENAIKKLADNLVK